MICCNLNVPIALGLDSITISSSSVIAANQPGWLNPWLRRLFRGNLSIFTECGTLERYYRHKPLRNLSSIEAGFSAIMVLKTIRSISLGAVS